MVLSGQINNGLHLPDWVVDRPGQDEAVEEILDCYASGAEVVVLDAPPGTGKTLIAEKVRQRLVKRGLYIATTKSLQEQFAKDFPYAALLKGRANYPTMRKDLFGGNYGVTAGDCTKRNEGDIRVCDWCEPVGDCPYEQAKHKALKSDLAILNTSYFLTESNGPGRFSERDFCVIDEADLLESELMRYIGFEISDRRVRELGLGEPAKVTKEESWANWVREAIGTVKERLSRQPSKDNPSKDNDRDIRVIREAQYLNRVYQNLQNLRKGLEDGGWIYTGKNGAVSFKPIRVSEQSTRLLWKHSKRWLLMSATIVSPSVMLEELGYDGNWSFVSVPSTFPIASRQVKYTPVANVIRSEGERAWEEIARGIIKITARHPGENMLVHTVSHDFTRFLSTYLAKQRQQTYSYVNAAERDKALRKFTEQPKGIRNGQHTRSNILLAASMDRGIDLPDDACRIVVIAKVPYPYLGDRQVSARLHSKGGKIWYHIQTVRSIIQMSGRATRHKDDWSVTYILDQQFLNIWNKARGLFPEWWKDAIDWRDKL